MSATEKRVFASEAITRICRELNYSRSHVAKLLREKRKILDARIRQGRWELPAQKEAKLRALVKQSSGRRYKLGEKGPRT